VVRFTITPSFNRLNRTHPGGPFADQLRGVPSREVSMTLTPQPSLAQRRAWARQHLEYQREDGFQLRRRGSWKMARIAV